MTTTDEGEPAADLSDESQRSGCQMTKAGERLLRSLVASMPHEATEQVLGVV